ncbi:MAG: ScpA family protein [Patescibacteria group bacterium]
MENEVLENAYVIKTAGFEGPFGLLLNLIEARKLFVNDISLAQVTEDYLKYVNNLGGLSPAEVSSFVVVAATLILIKSKSLLPNLALTDEEESDIKNLEDRLKLYEIYSKLSLNIKENFGKKIIFAPLERKNDILVFLPDDQITKESMMMFVEGALGRMPKKTFLPEVEVKKVISIEEMIDKLTARIQDSLRMNFKDFAGGAQTKEERVVVIVGFLAMLELVRGGILNAMQDNNFEDIIIEKSAPVELEQVEIIVEN